MISQGISHTALPRPSSPQNLIGCARLSLVLINACCSHLEALHSTNYETGQRLALELPFSRGRASVHKKRWPSTMRFNGTFRPSRILYDRLAKKFFLRLIRGPSILRFTALRLSPRDVSVTASGSEMTTVLLLFTPLHTHTRKPVACKYLHVSEASRLTPR